MQDWFDCPAPSCDDIARLADAAKAGLPAPFAALAAEVAIQVVDFADDATLRSMGMANPFELSGLYDGVPLTEKSFTDQVQHPDTVWLYRRPILDEWAERETVSLDRLVTHIVVHEFAHHFGWSDADIAKIDPWWE